MKLRKTKFRAWVSALAIAALTMVGLTTVATTASAHTGDILTEVRCLANGNYEVSYTLKLGGTNGKVGQMWWHIDNDNNWSFNGTPTSNTGLSNGPVTTTGNETVFLGSVEIPGTSTTTPWVYAWTKWDNFSRGSDREKDRIAGSCYEEPEDEEVTPALTFTEPTCEAPGTVSPTAHQGIVWTPSGSNSAKTYTATAADGWAIVGTSVFGPYNLEQLSPNHEDCYEEPEYVCLNLGQDLTEVPAGYTQDGDTCFRDVYVCWEIRDASYIASGFINGVSTSNQWPNGLPTFPQDFRYQGATAELVKDYCLNLEVTCEDVRQFQVDKYRIDSTEDETILSQLVNGGVLYSGASNGPGAAQPGDGKLWSHYEWAIFLQIVNTEDCPEICYYDENAEGGPAWGPLEVKALQEGDIEWTGNAKDCYEPDTAICYYDENAEGGPAWVDKVVYADEVGNATLWTGEARDCFEPEGSVQYCAAGDAEGTYSVGSLPWKATWTNGAWVFTFTGKADGDIVPPVNTSMHGFPVAFDGENWPEEFSGEGGLEAWQAFLKNDCETPVDSSVEWESDSSLICEDPNGSYSYTVTIGSFEPTFQFFIQKDGETPELLGTVEPGETDTFSDNAVAPGSYTIYGMAVEAEASLLIAELQAPGPDERFTYAFTLDFPEDCVDIIPTALGGECVDGAPYLSFSIVVNDPYGEVTFPRDATAEFLNTKNGDGNHPVTLTLRTDAADYTAGGITFAYSAVGTTHTWTGTVLWPGAAVDLEGNPTEWPGWQNNGDGTYTNVGLSNFGWTRGGVDVDVTVNPTITVESLAYPAATAECDTPPPVDVCEYSEEDGAEMVTYYGTAPEGSIPWVDGNECTPIEICALDGETYYPMTIMVSELGETDRLWNSESDFQGGCREPQEPTLTGTVLNSVCVADSPWLRYSITVHNPDNQPLEGFEEGEELFATITFHNPGGEDHVITDLPVSELGYTLWPGASIAPAEGLTEADIVPGDSSTFIPTGWPGWYQDDLGAWFEYEDPQDNFGWTRGETTITIAVNPETTITVNYPPPTPTCASEPPEEFTNVAGAPPLPSATPAVPVRAVATYAG